MDRRSFCDEEADYSRVVDGVWRPGPSRKSNPRSGRGRGQLNYLDSPDVRMSDRKIQNRTSGSPESSDDNLSNMLNGKTHDKEKWYVKNVKCDDHFVKRDRAGNWAKSDATRKRYNFDCHGTDSGDSRRSSVSSVNAYKWVKKTQNWRMGKQQPLMNLPVDAPKNNINGDVDSKRRPILTSPFYYTVPEDTARVNSLPPGVYLIIPMMCVKPGMSQALREPLDGGSSGNKKKQAVKKKNDKSDQKGAAKDSSETQEDTNTEDGKKNGTGTDQDDKEGNAAAAAAVEEVAANIADVLLAVEALPGTQKMNDAARTMHY
ncbi:UNVERIFIED_CONTAM: hypothetical protein PYX00_000290 [Menopon gallinae]|uniref:Uncharacterized protein n=1 Tax=Menopon gallinae TaxID=328185 RepID=A0AAW2I8D5_9NEOP